MTPHDSRRAFWICYVATVTVALAVLWVLAS